MKRKNTGFEKNKKIPKIHQNHGCIPSEIRIGGSNEMPWSTADDKITPAKLRSKHAN